VIAIKYETLPKSIRNGQGFVFNYTFVSVILSDKRSTINNEVLSCNEISVCYKSINGLCYISGFGNLLERRFSGKLVNMVCMANDFVSMVLSVGITMFLCAPVYMLMVSRIGKRFVTLIYMTLLGVIFLLMGNWFLLPYFIVTGVICEVILWKEGSCQKPKRLTAAWTAASLLYNGVNLLPIWFFWDTYYDFALASGMEQSYIDSYVRYYTSPGWLAFILLFTTLMGFLGCMVGSRLIRRHFQKAGVL